MGRLPIPAGLKRYLVPIWNEAHRIGWLLRDYGSACLQGRWERCAVCGRVPADALPAEGHPRRLEELWGLTPRLAAALRGRNRAIARAAVPSSGRGGWLR